MTATLILGPHVSAHGDSVKVCEELAERLRGAGWPIWTASHRKGGLERTVDAVASVLRWRRRTAAACRNLRRDGGDGWRGCCNRRARSPPHRLISRRLSHRPGGQSS